MRNIINNKYMRLLKDCPRLKTTQLRDPEGNKVVNCYVCGARVGQSCLWNSIENKKE